MSPSEERPTPLSVHRAFVVQFHADTQLETGRVVGRVEHVVSGKAVSFQSLEALLAFVARVLREVHEPSRAGPDGASMSMARCTTSLGATGQGDSSSGL
jgi:hypothetical protein